MKILIIEDDLNKLANVEAYLKKYFSNKQVSYMLDVKHSYQSGLEMIIQNTYDLLLLDMSLPNFDIDEKSDGGNPLSRGGELILYEMDILGIDIATLVITQHDDFEGESLESINEEYKNNFSSFYIGYVFYSAIESNWKKDLEKKLNEVLDD